jgi:hypothetical protein
MIGTKKAVAMFGGAAALAFAVGFGGGVGVSSLGDATAATTQTPASGVHVATLTGCVSGLDC